MSQVYFLIGGDLVTYGVAEDAVTSSTTPITDVWTGLPEQFHDGLDAALNWGDGKAYFFRGSEYVRVDIATGAVETEARSIAEFWNGMADVGFDSDLHAAVNYGNGTVYFFKGESYASYGVTSDKVEGTGAIADWQLSPGGELDGGIDAVVNYGDGQLYFFLNDQYVRYDTAAGAVATEIRTVGEFWTGMDDAGFTSGFTGSWCAANPSAASTPSGGGTTTGSADPAALVSGADIDAYFTATTGMGFIDWFNANHANQGAFAPTANRRFQMQTDADTRARFTTFWNNIPVIFDSPSIRLVQFLGLQTIFINELGGIMAPVTERFNPTTASAHPGIAYLFDKFGGKASYNVGPGKTALDCFNNQEFLDAHFSLAFHAELGHTTDQVWAGTTYPTDRFPTGLPESGIIAETDFCKFRGRGMIQTTWRAGYLPIIEFVQGYSGGNATVLAKKQAWSGKAKDSVAYTSTNADWDDLFQRSDYVIPAVGIKLHARHTGYLAISDDDAVRNAKGVGSFHEMGLRISGSSSYGDLFSQRCQQLKAALP